MQEISTTTKSLPQTLEEKTKYVLFGAEALNIYRAKLRAMEKAGISKEQYDQLKIEAQETAENLLLFSADIGKEIEKIPKASKNQYMVFDGNDKKHKDEAIHEMGFTDRQARDFQTLAKNPESVKRAIQKAKDDDRVVTRQDVFKEINAENENRRQAEARKLREAKQRFDNYQEPTGKITSFETAKQHKEDGSMVFNDLYNIVNDAYLSILRVSGKFDQEINQKALASASVIEVRSMTTKLENCHRFVIKAMKILSEVTNEKQL